jgi:hypothetical protein
MALELTGTPDCYRRAIALLTTAHSDDELWFSLLLSECGFDDVRVLVDLAHQGIEHIAELEGSSAEQKLETLSRVIAEAIAETPA